MGKLIKLPPTFNHLKKLLGEHLRKKAYFDFSEFIGEKEQGGYVIGVTLTPHERVALRIKIDDEGIPCFYLFLYDEGILFEMKGSFEELLEKLPEGAADKEAKNQYASVFHLGFEMLHTLYIWNCRFYDIEPKEFSLTHFTVKPAPLKTANDDE